MGLLLCLLSSCLHEITQTYNPGVTPGVVGVHGDSAYVMAHTRLGWIYDSELKSHRTGECLLLNFTYNPSVNKQAQELDYYNVTITKQQTVERLSVGVEETSLDQVLTHEQPLVYAISPADSSLCAQVDNYLFLPSICWTNESNKLKWTLTYDPRVAPDELNGKRVYPLFLRTVATGVVADTAQKAVAAIHAFDLSAVRQALGGSTDDRYVRLFYVDGINPADSTQFTWGVSGPIVIH